jgi:hypothetical protein
MSHVFDEALERLRGTGTEVGGRGAPNHGPMAAEALTALGRDDDVVGWGRIGIVRGSRQCPRRLLP